MIKKIKKSISLFEINPLDKDSLMKLYQGLIHGEVPKNEDLIFKELEFEDGYLSGKLITKVPSMIYDMDNDFILRQKKIFFFVENDFAFDSNVGLFEASCPAKDIPKIKSALQFFFREREFSTLNISPYKFLSFFEENISNYKVINISINNFKYSPHIIGKYTALIRNKDEGKKLIEEYSSGITKVSISMNFSKIKEDITLDISFQGRIQIKCSEEIFNEFFFYLKNTIIKKIKNG